MGTCNVRGAMTTHPHAPSFDIPQASLPSTCAVHAWFMLWVVLPRTRFCPHEPPTALAAGLTTTASTKWTAPTARFHQPQPVS